MRIGLFHPAFAVPGGAEFLCLAEALYLRSAGDEVRLITLQYDAERWQSRLDGLPVSLAVKRHWTDLFGGFSAQARMRNRGRRAAALMRGLEVVLAHNYPCSAMLGAARQPVRKVWQCNEPPRLLHVEAANPALTARAESAGPDAVDESTRAWQKVLRQHAAEMKEGKSIVQRREYDLAQVARIDHLYAISAFSRDNARRIYGRCGEEVVYPIVRFPAGGRTRVGLNRAELGVLVHSRLEKLKNIDTVIRGFAAFHGGRPGSHLHVVGDGESRASLETLAAELLPRTAFTFHGYLSDADLRRVYEACDVFALLTLDEPFGMVYPEAAAKGLLLIGPDHGGPFEILDGGRLGWCVNPFDPAALKDALEQVGALSDTEADRRREEADRACRARFAEAVVGPQLRRVVLHGHC